MKAVKFDEPKPNQAKLDIDEGFSVRDALNILFCHKWKIILFFLTISSVVTIVTYRTPSVYSSGASLLIGVGRERIDIAPVLKPSQYLNQGQIERVNNEMVILKSRYLAAQTVDSIGLKRFFSLFKTKQIDGFPLQSRSSLSENNFIDKPGNPPASNNEEKPEKPEKAKKPPKPKCQIFTEQARKRADLESDFLLFKQLPEEGQMGFWYACQAAMSIIVGGLSIDTKPKSFIVNLGLSTRHPLLAQLILEHLIAVYIDRYLELRAPKASADVFRSRFNKFAEELNKNEKDLFDYRREHKISELISQRNILISKISELMSKISTADTAVLTLKAKIKQLEKTLTRYTKTVEVQRVEGRTNYVADALKNMLYKYQSEENETAAFYPDDSRKLIEIRQRIALVEKALSEQPESLSEVTRGINRQYESHQLSLDNARIDYITAKTRAVVLKNDLEKRESELEKLISHELVIKHLERKIELSRQEFQSGLDVMTRADSYQALNDSKVVSIDVIETPSYDADPIKPNKPMNIILGVVFGLMGGLGIAFLIDYFDDSMKTNEDVKRRLQLPVLAMVSSGEFYKCI